MVKQKIRSADEVSFLVKKAREKGRKVGLVTGCFDILHLGHIELFRFAKKKVDILIVGVDNDDSIRISKGRNRPLNTQRERISFLSEVLLLDYIFPIEKVYTFDASEASMFHKKLLRKINPEYLITATIADRYWKNKKKITEELGIKFLPDTRRRKNASSKIIEKLEKEL